LTETYTVTGYNSTLLELSIAATGMLNGAPISQTVSYTVDAMGNVNLVSFQVTPAGGTTLYLRVACALRGARAAARPPPLSA
jgi:hypothetical protein